jgi:hypothetical protein
MSEASDAPRSRRAILAAAASAAAALAATTMVPATASAADPDDVVKGQDNPTTSTTQITDSTADNDAFASYASGIGFGFMGSSVTGVGVVGFSVTLPGWFDREQGVYTGVFGAAPEGDHITTYGTGVWGDSPDTGVLGTGGYGVVGYGGIGVEGDANDLTGSIGVVAWAPTTAQYALKAFGKVAFSRSGRQAIATGKSSVVKSLAGVTTSSKVFAVLATSESGRYVRAVVPAAGKFTVYLNTTLTSSAVVSWFVLD